MRWERYAGEVSLALARGRCAGTVHSWPAVSARPAWLSVGPSLLSEVTGGGDASSSPDVISPESLRSSVPCSLLLLLSPRIYLPRYVPSGTEQDGKVGGGRSSARSRSTADPGRFET